MLNNAKKILVVDDDEDILLSISCILELEGYQVSTTADGNPIIGMTDNLPNAILLDIWMKGIDGRDVCKALKASEKTRKIPVIMISANKNGEELAKEAGADDFIAKPFEMDHLLAKVAKYSNPN